MQHFKFDSLWLFSTSCSVTYCREIPCCIGQNPTVTLALAFGCKLTADGFEFHLIAGATFTDLGAANHGNCSEIDFQESYNIHVGSTVAMMQVRHHSLLIPLQSTCTVISNCCNHDQNLKIEMWNVLSQSCLCLSCICPKVQVYQIYQLQC